jgi:hypothetical protein
VAIDERGHQHFALRIYYSLSRMVSTKSVSRQVAADPSNRSICPHLDGPGIDDTIALVETQDSGIPNDHRVIPDWFMDFFV